MVDDLPEDLLVDRVHFAVGGGIHGIEECRKRVAQAEAAAAAVADIEHALQLLGQRGSS